MPLFLLDVTEPAEVANLKTLFGMFAQWMIDIVGTITSHPILMLGLSIFCVGAVIGLAYRLIRG